MDRRHRVSSSQWSVRAYSPVCAGIDQTRRRAYERDLRQSLLSGTYNRKEDEIPTLEEWFNGRFWLEWVIGRKNKPGEMEQKKLVFRNHVKAELGKLRLDQIDTAAIAKFRAKLALKGLRDKTVNNILAVVSKPLHYAADCELIPRAPKVGLLRTERPEIIAWELDEYARLLGAAREEGRNWYVAVCLAGEAGLRVGEVRALRWRQDLDLTAGTITVNQQMRQGMLGTPKGRTRRTVPMSSTLLAAIQPLLENENRTGYVVRGADAEPRTEGQFREALYRICRRAGLPDSGWHRLRHSFGTHAALFGVNPWRLQAWMGHKRIDETMRYVHVAAGHARALPPVIVEAANGVQDPDRRVLQMLGQRVHVGLADKPAHQSHGTWLVG